MENFTQLSFILTKLWGRRYNFLNDPRNRSYYETGLRRLIFWISIRSDDLTPSQVITCVWAILYTKRFHEMPMVQLIHSSHVESNIIYEIHVSINALNIMSWLTWLLKQSHWQCPRISPYTKQNKEQGSYYITMWIKCQTNSCRALYDDDDDIPYLYNALHQDPKALGQSAGFIPYSCLILGDSQAIYTLSQRENDCDVSERSQW